MTLIERFANLSHEQWRNWMDYLFSQGVENEDGTVTIPKWAVDRWERQLQTNYQDLPEQEKESDRNEAKKYLKELRRFREENELI